MSKGSKYVNVSAKDLNISDLVQGRGKVIREVVDHETLEGFVVVVFEKGDEEKLDIIFEDRQMRVRCEDCDS